MQMNNADKRSIVFTDEIEGGRRPELSAPDHFLGYEPPPLGRSEMKLGEYVAVLRPYLSLILIFCLAPVLLCAIIVFQMTPQYMAQSTVQISDSKPRALDSQQVATEEAGNAAYDFYRTQYDILKSRQLATQVILNLGLQNSNLLNGSSHSLLGGITGMLARLRPAARNAEMNSLGLKPSVIDAYLSRLSIAPLMGTQLVGVEFSTPDPQLSAHVVNAHVRAYIQRGVELNVESNRAVADYLQKNLVEVKDKVQNAQAALNTYRKARGIVTFSVQNPDDLMMTRMSELTSGLTKAQERRIELGTEYQLIQNHNYDALPEVRQSQLIQILREQVSDVSAKYASLANRFNPGYHRLDDLKALLDKSQAMLNKQIQDTVDGIKGNYQAAMEQEATVKTEIGQIKAEALALKDQSLQDSILSQDLESDQHLYEAVLKRVQEIQVAATVQTSTAVVIDEAQAPSRPSSPKIMLSLVLSGMIGLVLGLGTAFVLDYRDDRFKSKDEVVHYLHVPVVGVIPDFFQMARVGYGYGAKGHVSRYLSGEARAASPEDKDKNEHSTSKNSEIVVHSAGSRIPAEMYRMLRAAISFSRAGSPPKTVLFTSTLPDEGKTVTAINTAASFAQLGRSTLLIDADLRRGRLHELLDLENEVGLTQVLVGQAELSQSIRPTLIPNMSLISAGVVPPNPADLLSSVKMHEVLTQLQTDYDHIVIDSPPLIVSDSLALATIVDGTFIVVGPDTPKRLVRDVCEQFRYVGARILGVIMNRADLFQHRYNYGYDYYNHYYHSGGRGAAAPADDSSSQP
jgi:succinoglycan biosynthesis transport protein ExoP